MTYKFQQIKPQKARGKFQESLWTDPAWGVENKEDGDRRIAQFVGGIVRFTGSKESVSGGFVEKSFNIPHLSGARRNLHGDVFWADTPHLDGTVLDGEIVAPFAKDWPGGKSKYVTAIMGSKPERAIQLQKQHGWLEYRVFDCLVYKGNVIIAKNSLNARRVMVANTLAEWGNTYAKQMAWVEDEKRKRAAWECSEEGLVFKHQDHTYGNEKLWVKLKKKWTADVVIIGFEPGKGKYAGSVGAIIFGQCVANGNAPLQLGTCRGFTDAQMNSFTAHPKKFIGKVIEIDNNGREPTGAFRHPRFKKFRPDKSAADCVYDLEET